MTRRMETIQPPDWAKPKGYANGIIADGPLLFVAGQVGWDPLREEPTFPTSFVEQFEQALANVLAVVQTAGADASHVVRMTIYVVDKQAYLASLKELGQAWKRKMGRHYPVMALVQVAGLVEPGAMLEIEATAVLPR